MPQRSDFTGAPFHPEVRFDRAELRERLDPVQYRVTQEHDTERPYTNKYYR